MTIRTIIFLLAVISCGAEEMQAPRGFKVHDLGPLGGQILVPEGWYFVAGRSPGGPLFTVSKENSQNGSYDTGMRIQLMGKIKSSGLTPEEAVRMNIDRKKKLEQVVSECPEAQAGKFRRICLETEGFPSKTRPSQKFHLVYSFWWSDEMDMMAASTFGAPVEDWPQAARIYAVIKDFKLVDLDRVQKKPNQTPEPTPMSVTPPAAQEPRQP